MYESIALTGVNYCNLKEEAAALHQYIRAARSLHSGDPTDWQILPKEVVQHLLLGVMWWAGILAPNVGLKPPTAVHGVSCWTRLRLSDLLLWAVAGTFGENEQQALSAWR